MNDFDKSAKKEGLISILRLIHARALSVDNNIIKFTMCYEEWINEYELVQLGRIVISIIIDNLENFDILGLSNLPIKFNLDELKYMLTCETNFTEFCYISDTADAEKYIIIIIREIGLVIKSNNEICTEEFRLEILGTKDNLHI